MRDVPDSKDGLDSSVIKDQISALLTDIQASCPAQECPRDDLYVGSAGIAYAFYHLARLLPSDTDDGGVLNHLNVAEEYIKKSLHVILHDEPSKGGIEASLLSGHAGIYAVAALVYDALHNQQQNQAKNQSTNKQTNQQTSQHYLDTFIGVHKYCLPLNFYKRGSDEMFRGRAGYLSACLLLNSRLGRTAVPDEVILPVCRAIVESGRRYSKKNQHKCPLMYMMYEKEYLGAGHGLVAILLMLLSFPKCLQDDGVDRDLRASVDWVLTCEGSPGHYPTRWGKERRKSSDELVQWCHGSPGVVYLLAKAYLVWRDDKYLRAALRCGEFVWEKGLLRKGPSLCHGIAGNGYVFLLLYRITNDLLHVHRARQFSRFMQTDEFKTNARVPDRAHSLFEGTAGTVCYLVDLIDPDNPESGLFPFMGVF